jgi:4-amino-4-deoxy-L-arabinose transferase-like glycosyltransferase
VRLVSAIAGALSVLFVYLLGREMFNAQVGLMAAAFLILFPLHIHFSRIGVHNIVDSLMVGLCLWLALRALRTRLLSDYALSGITAGLSLYTYVGTRFVIILVFGVFFYLVVFQRKLIRQHLAGFGMFLLAIWVTTAPMAYYFIKNPLIFAGRIGQEGIIFNGWLVDQAARTGQSIFQVLADQFSRSTLVFIASEAPGNFLNSPRPYLTLLGAILALLGMAYSFSNIRQRSHAILLAWFWSIVFLGGVLTLNPPANTRMLMTTSAVALFVGLGIWQIIEVLRLISVRPRLRNGLAAALLLVLIVENGYFYLVEYPREVYFQDRNAEVAQHAAEQVAELGPNYGLYLLGAPHVFSGFPTSVFLAPDNPKYDPGAETIEEVSIPAGQGAFFAAIPENEALLDEIAGEFPGGERETFMRLAVPGEVLYYTYTLRPATSARP